jgi:hypothetical protein
MSSEGDVVDLVRFQLLFGAVIKADMFTNSHTNASEDFNMIHSVDIFRSC